MGYWLRLTCSGLPAGFISTCFYLSKILGAEKYSNCQLVQESLASSVYGYHLHTRTLQSHIRPLQFNQLSYKLFLEKNPVRFQKKRKKVTFGVLRTKVVLKFSIRLQKKKSFKNILCKGDSINYRKLSLL